MMPTTAQYPEKIYSDWRERYEMNHLIAIYPTIEDATKPAKYTGYWINSEGVCIKSIRANIPAADITGIAIKKENLAEDFLSKFLINPPDIVEPDLEIPGNRARTWNRPISRASIHDKSRNLRERLPSNSPRNNKRDVINKEIAVAVGLLKTNLNSLLNKIPTNPAGIVAKKRNHPSFEFSF